MNTELERSDGIPDVFSFVSRLNAGDWQAFIAACVAGHGTRAPTLLSLFGGAAFGLVVAIAGGFDAEQGYFGAWLVGGIALGTLLVCLGMRRTQQRLSPETDGSFFAPRLLRITPDTFEVESDGQTSRTRWQTFRSSSESPDHLILWLDRNIAEIVPWRDLPPEIPPAAFAELIRSRVAGGQAGGSGSNSLEPETQARDFNQSPPAGAASGLLVTMAFVGVTTWIILDWIGRGPGVQFDLDGVPGILWHGVPALLAAWVISRSTTPALSFPAALINVLMAVPPTLVAAFLLAGATTAADEPSGAGTEPLAWIVGGVVLLVLLRYRTGRMQFFSVAAALICTIGFQWLDDRTYVNSSMWYAVTDSTESAAEWEEWQRAEPILFSQAGRIDQAVARMSPREGQFSAFLVGFAGYAEQQVFAEEIRFAADVLGSRYGTAERTLLLVNDARVDDAAPLASVSGLHYGIQRIAERMDRKNDLLILALSSHGSRDASIAVSNGTLPLRDLTAGHLRSALDDAGVQWRLVLISACFAGSFVDELADPYTAVIASAAPDRTSFGCSNDRDLTYFGEAFYRDALPIATTLQEAFETAKGLVTERELAAGYEPSMPMAFFGPELVQKLATLDTGSGIATR